MAKHPTQAMQGGDITGAVQKRIEAAVLELKAAVRASMEGHPIPPDHAAQEEASIIIQAVIAETTEPGAFLEGAMTQLGWQSGMRGGGQVGLWAQRAVSWFSTGLEFAKAEPLTAPPKGRA